MSTLSKWYLCDMKVKFLQNIQTLVLPMLPWHMLRHIHLYYVAYCTVIKL